MGSTLQEQSACNHWNDNGAVKFVEGTPNGSASKAESKRDSVRNNELSKLALISSRSPEKVQLHENRNDATDRDQATPVP